MVLLEYHNWKKRLPFDNVVYKDVKRYTLRLNTMERDLMNLEIDFYRSRFSLEQVMRSFKTLKTDKEREVFIKAVLKRTDNIFYLPDCLYNHYKTKIKKEFPNFRGFFELLLEKANKQTDKNPLPALYKPLLGRYHKTIMNKIDKYAKTEAMRTYGKKIKPDAYDAVTRDRMSKLKLDITLATIYGRCTQAGRLPLSIVDDTGRGAWISKKVSYATDRFFLYTNRKSITDEHIDHMLLYNVYPGKGHFYNTVLEKNNNICFDNGARILIEGWADYAACHSRGMAYSYSLLAERCRMAKYLLKKKLKKGYKDAWLYIMNRYPRDRAIEIMVDCTQFPGNYLASVIGHFGVEAIINTDFAMGPKDFLEVMGGVNCGDYLAVYHPKVQRKLAETSITARVSRRIS